MSRAREDSRKIIEVIIAKYNPRRIYQCGSLLDAESFSEISDIDIAVEGLTGAEQFFAALGDAMQLTSFPVDLIELEKIPPEIAERIRKQGKLIHERDETA